MPDYAGLIKYPTGGDIYGGGKEPQWWKDLAVTALAEISAQVAGSRFEKASRLPGDDLNNAVEPGQYPYWAGALNAPGGSGVAYVSTLLTTSGKVAQVTQLALTSGGTSELHTRFRGTGGWSGWTRIDVGAIDLPALGGGGSGASPASFKTVPLALTVGGGGHAGPTSGIYRMPLKFGATITRWRAHFRNNNPRFGTDGPPVSISNVYFGPASNGDFSSSSRIGSTYSTGTTGTVTPWVSTPINAGTEYALSYQFSGTATNRVVGGGWSASSVNSTSATLTRVTSLPLDVWIEAEVAPEVPVIAAFGDSLSSGVGATLPVHDSWLSQWTRANGALPVHYTASGDTMAGWADSNAYKWQRWQGLTRPDAVVHNMGSNDVFNGANLATLQERRAASIEQLGNLVSPVIYTATITPRTSSSGAEEAVRRSYNTWLKGLPDAARDVFDFVPAISGDDERISPGFDADGIHLNTAGYAAVAGAITRPLASTALPTALTRLAALDYDSGLRDVSDLLLQWRNPGGSGVTLARLGSNVEFAWTNRPFSASGVSAYGTLLFTLPPGFRPRATYRTRVDRPNTAGIQIATNGEVTLTQGEISLNQFVDFRFSHTTTEAPPSTANLPGSAA